MEYFIAITIFFPLLELWGWLNDRKRTKRTSDKRAQRSVAGLSAKGLRNRTAVLADIDDRRIRYRWVIPRLCE